MSRARRVPHERGREALLFMAALVLGAPALDAQDPCAELQAALDAAPPGATVHASDYPFGCGGGIVIRKPVTLVGGYFSFSWDQGGVFGPPTIRLEGPGSGTVTLIGCTTGGSVSSHGSVGPAIGGGGFDTLHVYQSTIRGQSYCGYGYFATGSCAVTSECEGSLGAPAIAVDVQTLLIERSIVEGSAVATGGIGRLPAVPGVLAPDTLVVAVDSEIHGGNAGDYFVTGPNVPCSPNERTPFHIPGGAAVECLELIRVRSILAGGRGGRWTRTGPIVGCTVTGGYSYPCYQSPDGPEVVRRESQSGSATQPRFR